MVSTEPDKDGALDRDTTGPIGVVCGRAERETLGDGEIRGEELAIRDMLSTVDTLGGWLSDIVLTTNDEAADWVDDSLDDNTPTEVETGTGVLRIEEMSLDVDDSSREELCTDVCLVLVLIDKLDAVKLVREATEVIIWLGVGLGSVVEGWLCPGVDNLKEVVSDATRTSVDTVSSEEGVD